jgi:hypothetical protein
MCCFDLKQIKFIFCNFFTKKNGIAFLSIAETTSKKNANSYRNLENEGAFLRELESLYT